MSENIPLHVVIQDDPDGPYSVQVFLLRENAQKYFETKLRDILCNTYEDNEEDMEKHSGYKMKKWLHFGHYQDDWGNLLGIVPASLNPNEIFETKTKGWLPS